MKPLNVARFFNDNKIMAMSMQPSGEKVRYSILNFGSGRVSYGSVDKYNTIGVQPMEDLFREHDGEPLYCSGISFDGLIKAYTGHSTEEVYVKPDCMEPLCVDSTGSLVAFSPDCSKMIRLESPEAAEIRAQETKMGVPDPEGYRLIASRTSGHWSAVLVDNIAGNLWDNRVLDMPSIAISDDEIVVAIGIPSLNLVRVYKTNHVNQYVFHAWYSPGIFDHGALERVSVSANGYFVAFCFRVGKGKHKVAIIRVWPEDKGSVETYTLPEDPDAEDTSCAHLCISNDGKTIAAVFSDVTDTSGDVLRFYEVQ